MHAPAITFAIPCCNGKAHLEPLLESILQQTRQDFVLILVDDASSDGSAAIAERVAGKRAQIVVNERRLGLAANFAHAASLVRTPYFCLAHQDDAYAPDYLARLLPALEGEPTAALAHCSATAMDGDGNAIVAAAERFKHGLARRAVGASRARLHELLWHGNFICCPSVLFRTAAYHSVGGFDVSLSFALDWDLWFRLLESGFGIVTVVEPLVRYRRHGSNASNAATRTLRRFREEMHVLARAQAAGTASGLFTAGRPPSRSLRNNLVNEAFEDLRAGQREAFDEKLAFARAHLPELWWDPLLVGLRCMSRCGPIGTSLLGLLRAAAVRMGVGS